jgi:L-arabinonolactonase
MQRIGDFSLVWGESVRWDDRLERLYFVDCATQTLHWLEGGEPPLHTMHMPSLPTGIALTGGSELVVCLDDGLHVVDPDAQTTRRLTEYPEGLNGRANDAHADGFGNLVTGTLNMGPGRPGSLWWFSGGNGWRMLDPDVANTNGPVVVAEHGRATLVVSDTVAARTYAYDYDGSRGAVGERTVLCDHARLAGAPDGSAVDADSGVWSCVLTSGKLVRVTSKGIDRVLDLPMANPSDAAFGGAELTRLFVTSIALVLGDGRPPAEEASWLVAFDDLGVTGRPEPRFDLPARA